MNTVHSIIRAKERAGMKYGEAVRFTELAIRNGQRAKDLPVKERRYMEKKEIDSSITAVFYNGFIFVMENEELCITLFKAPSWFLKKDHYDGKKKVRDVKKYLRYNYAYGMEVA